MVVVSLTDDRHRTKQIDGTANTPHQTLLSFINSREETDEKLRHGEKFRKTSGELQEPMQTRTYAGYPTLKRNPIDFFEKREMEWTHRNKTLFLNTIF